MSLRILQIASMNKWAGTEKYVVDLSAGLTRRGHAVTIACPPDVEIERRVRTLGLPTIPLYVRRLHDWRQLPTLVSAFAGKTYDVVHIHCPIDFLVPAAAARLARVPAVIMTRHMPNPFASRLRANLCSMLLSDRTIAVSNFIRQVLLDSGVPARRITTVLNGIDSVPATPDARRRLRAEFGIPLDAVLVAAVGRLRPEKGFDVLLQAIAELRRSSMAVYCVIFGDGVMRAQLQQLVRELGIASCTRLPGFRSDVTDLWGAVDLAAVPSVADDALPYAAMEAIAAGRPVVGSNLGGIPEIVSSECGLLTRPGAISDLTSAIRLLAQSPELRARMGQGALERSRRFTLAANVEGVERVYASALGRRQAKEPLTATPASL